MRLAEVLEGMLVNQEVVHDAQDAVGDGHRGLLGAAPRREPSKLCGKARLGPPRCPHPPRPSAPPPPRSAVKSGVASPSSFPPSPAPPSRGPSRNHRFPLRVLP